MSEWAQNLPPHSEEAESAVLAAMFRERDSIHEVVQLIKEEDFYLPENGIMFRVMVEMNEAAEPIDLITVTERLRKMNLLEKAGGLKRVAQVAGAIGSVYNCAHYAKIIREKSVLRKLIHATGHISDRSFEDADPVEDILDEAEKLVLDISQDRARGGLVPVGEIVDANLERLEKLSQQTGDLTGTPSGFVDLDHITSGWQKSDFIIIAARPAMGKTALCLNMASNAAMGDKGVPVAIFSLEMSKEQLVQRLISATAQVDQSYLRTGSLPEEDWAPLVAAIGPLAEAPIYIDDTPAISIRELRAKARRLQAEYPDLGLIIIDYLQLMGGSGKSENRQQEVSEISRSLKALARELDVPVIALSQLSRSVEATQDKRPALSHLRESGSLEQDADLVLFIYREEYYFPEETERQGIADIIIAKHRNGATGSVALSFQKEFTKFGNLAQYAEPPRDLS